MSGQPRNPGAWIRSACTGILALALLCDRASAQLPEGAADVPSGLLPGRPRVSPGRLGTPPVIDGRLQEDEWSQAAVLTEFVQASPSDGAPASEATEVFVGYDRDHLFFGFHATYEDPSIMRASRVDRDEATADDLFSVYLDPFLDQLRAYRFDVNAYGVQGDGVLNAGGGFVRAANRAGAEIPAADRSWNALFESAGQIVADGYTAEIAIPLKSIRYPQRPEGESHQWGLQIIREIRSKDQEVVTWAPMSRDQPSFYSQMGVLDGMTGLSSTHNIEFLPTLTAIRYGAIRARKAGGPGFVNDGTDPEAGVNVKYGLTSDLVLNFTLNPEFSQIESDRPQIEVNQRFPLFFQELRPFFIEGSEIFEVAAPATVVHTRTIIDPDYGAKLSGTLGRMNLGFLTTNDAAAGRMLGPENPASRQDAHVYIGRGKFEVRPESHIGAVVTGREFLDGHSRLAGLDGNLRLGTNQTVRFNITSTRHLEGGLERAGHLADVFVRRAGRNFEFYVHGFEISPEFETDVGFIRRRDQRQIDSRVAYQFWPESWLINLWQGLRNYRNYDFGDLLQEELLRYGLDITFPRNINFHMNVERLLERFAGIDFHKPRITLRTNIDTSRAISLGARLGIGDQIRFVEDPFLGDEIQWGVNAVLRPSPRLTSNLSLDGSRLTDARQGGREVFSVEIYRVLSTFQFTDRFQIRNITEYNTYDQELDLNFLLTYRVNAGTVVYAGYDDHYRRADRSEEMSTGTASMNSCSFRTTSGEPTMRCSSNCSTC